METSIIVAIIGGCFTLVGVLLSNQATRNAITSELKIHQAVTDEKLESLTREVREHNEFARRVPVIEEQMKVANHRIDDLEKGKTA